MRNDYSQSLIAIFYYSENEQDKGEVEYEMMLRPVSVGGMRVREGQM